MCGIPRPSSGHRIAIMFPSPSPSPSPSYSLSSSPTSSPSSSPEPQLPAQESYSLFFRESEPHTKAVFRSKDVSTMDSFRSCNDIDLRIERHGDLTISHPGLSLGQIAPLHTFQLRPSSSPLSSEKKAGEMEFSLPQKLDLGVSEQGIVGRKVTVVARGEGGEVLQMGNGIVGYD